MAAPVKAIHIKAVIKKLYIHTLQKIFALNIVQIHLLIGVIKKEANCAFVATL